MVPLVRGLKTQLAVTWEGEEAGLGDTYQHTPQGTGCFETLEKPVKSKPTPKGRARAKRQARTEGQGDILNFIRIPGSLQILITENPS